MPIRATHTPATTGGLPHGPPSVRYDTQHPWPGIPAENWRDWCQRCTRATLHGIRQVKYIDQMCDTHGSWVRHGLPPRHHRPLPARLR